MKAIIEQKGARRWTFVVTENDGTEYASGECVTKAIAFAEAAQYMLAACAPVERGKESGE